MFFQCILCNIIIKIFDHAVKLSAICADEHGCFWKFCYNRKLLLLKLFIKLSTRLIDKFYKINDLHVKFHITGTDLRCLHKIRCKLL